MDYTLHVVLHNHNEHRADLLTLLNDKCGKLLAELPAIRMYQISVPEAHSFNLMSALDESPIVKFAEFDIANKVKLASVPYIPSASFYASEHDAYDYMNAPKGWGITRGSSEEILAVIDEGTDLTHPEFVGQIYDSVVVSTGLPQSGAYPAYQTHGTLTVSPVAKGINIQGMASGCRAFVIDAQNPYVNITGAIDLLVQRKLANNYPGRVISISIGNETTYTTVTPVSSDLSHKFQISGDATYLLNGRIHTIGNGWSPVFGTVTAVSYASGSTICTVAWDTAYTGSINVILIHSMIYETAWEAAWNAGFIIFLSAGNSRTLAANNLMSTRTVLVGAAVSSGVLTDYTNFGPTVKLSAATADGDVLACAPVSLPNDNDYSYMPVASFPSGATELTLSSPLNPVWYFKLVVGTGIADGTLIMPVYAGTNKVRLSKPTIAAVSGIAPKVYGSRYYVWGAGTSHAAPMTAALALLIYSVLPNISRDDLLSSILTTRQPVAASLSYQVGAGDIGCIDVYNAIHKAMSKTQLLDLNLQVQSKGNNGFSFSLDPAKWAHSYRVYIDGTRWPSPTAELSPAKLTQVITGLSAGDHTLAVSMVAQNVESALSDSITVTLNPADPAIQPAPAPMLAPSWVDPLTVPVWTTPPTTPTITITNGGVLSMTGGLGAERVYYFIDPDANDPAMLYEDPLSSLPWISASQLPYELPFGPSGSYYFMVFVQNAFGSASSNTIYKSVVYTPAPKVARKLRSPSGGKIRGKGAGKVSGKPQ